MGHHNTEMDAESLQRVGRRRSGCLDVFLVMSIVFLFVAVTAVAAGGVLVVLDLQSKLKPSPPAIDVKTSKYTQDTPDSVYKMQYFAYLEANSSRLENSNMQWAPVLYGTGKSVGSNFLFDSEQHSLKPERAGTYFMYIELNLTCTFTCNAGLLSVHVGDKLTCEVELPAVPHSPVSKKCWTVTQMDGQKLFTQMTVSKGLENWKLEMGSSGFGMFLVD
ncbi:uncharacterized protein [Trachinotus anak]|uniref:uncharacterized protein n=1 Tax=Trachinotus anak TaxID=443729 RepID=UPI0039F1FDDE